MAERRVTMDWVLASLGRFYGKPPKPVSGDPFELILYEQVGYLATDAVRLAAFQRLRREVGLTPRAILAAPTATLVAITRSGGSIAAPLRAERLRESAELVERRWDGDLRQALALPLREARRALTAFAMIGAPGADRILAVTGAHPVLGLDSNGLRVCVRLGWGSERKSYSATYRAVQEALAGELPEQAAPLAAASALLRKHGETVCRRTTPDCGHCVLAKRCEYAASKREPG